MEASEKAPFLALVLKLEMPIVREILSREEVEVPDAPPDTPRMATGEITLDLWSAFRRPVT